MLWRTDVEARAKVKFSYTCISEWCFVIGDKAAFGVRLGTWD